MQNRRTRRRLPRFFLLTTMLAVLADVTPARACTCSGTPSLEQEVNASAAVFLGQVTRAERHYDAEAFHRAMANRKFDPMYSKAFGTEVVFRVIKSWKGAAQRTINVWTGLSSSDCGHVFPIGMTFLIFARLQADGSISTSLCTRTAELLCARADIQKLDRLLNTTTALPAIDFNAVYPIKLCMDGPRHITPIDLVWPRGLLSVGAELAIGASGKVISARVTQCAPSCTDAYKKDAEARMMKWRFTPAKIDGHPVAVKNLFGFGRPRGR